MIKLLSTDPHIEESAISELNKIFEEICTHSADILIMLGDYYHKRNPNTLEIIFGTKWAVEFKKKYNKVIFLRGNHDRTRDTSAVDYLKYLGIEIVDDFLDENNNYYGHFMTNKSLYEYGSYQKTVKELKKYNKVFLGHQHNFQEIEKDKMFHIGSIRFINFNEVTDPFKRIILLEDDKVKFINLKSPIPMNDAHSIDDLQDIKLSSKVRLIISSFDQFKKEINSISKWKDKFIEFKVKLDFSKTIVAKDEKIVKHEKKRLQDILRQGIAKVEDEEVRKLLLKQMEDIK